MDHLILHVGSMWSQFWTLRLKVETMFSKFESMKLKKIKYNNILTQAVSKVISTEQNVLTFY